MSKETSYEKVKTECYTAVIKSVTCDGCGKTENKLPDSWHEFSGHHHGWGNDSIESYEYFHACSPACYLKALKKAFSEFEEYKSAEIDSFAYDFVKGLVELANGAGMKKGDK